MKTELWRESWLYWPIYNTYNVYKLAYTALLKLMLILKYISHKFHNCLKMDKLERIRKSIQFWIILDLLCVQECECTHMLVYTELLKKKWKLYRCIICFVTYFHVTRYIVDRIISINRANSRVIFENIIERKIIIFKSAEAIACYNFLHSFWWAFHDF